MTTFFIILGIAAVYLFGALGLYYSFKNFPM